MRRISTLALLFAAYFAAAKIGLSFASVHPSVTAIWPPTGLAIAALLIFGRDVWPAIVVGAFLANVTTNGSILTSIGVALGNLLEGMLGAYLVERFAHGRHAFDRPPDIFRFVVLAGMLSTAVSATIGVTTLALGGLAAWNDYGPIWLTWWLGDGAGALLVAPLLLVWRNQPSLQWDRAQWLEGLLLLVVVIGSAAAVFGGFYAPTRLYPLAFVCIPPLVWTAFRFSQRETAVSILILLWVATWGTLRETGPFATAAPFARLLILQAFMGTVAAMVMSIAALVANQRRLLAAEHQAREAAEAANRAKDNFLAILGHELRNPLAAITTAVHVLDRVAPLEGKAARIRDVIAGQTSQLARLVDDLLDVSRISAGKIALQRKRVDLFLVVSQTLDGLLATGKADRHRFEFSGEHAWVEVDEARVQQMLNNLVSNALKYTPEGGTIQVTLAMEAASVALRVEDTGIGITPDLLPRIFDPFTQGERGPDRTQGGLGIGLTIVKRLAELHGGSVEAASAGPGHGATFTIRIPAASPRRTTDDAAAAGTPLRLRRVLVAEDQTEARELLCLALRSEGHHVFDARDGPGAVEAAKQSRPEVAVIDIGLPGFDGYEVARQIRSAAGGDEVYLIALTGYGQPDDKQRAQQAGFDLHIVKPVDPERLHALIGGASAYRPGGAPASPVR